MSINELYFHWLVNLINPEYKEGSYEQVLGYLHSREFFWTVETDDARAIDGVELRERFIAEGGYSYLLLDELDGPCSVLEMMVGLSVRCENEIMMDPNHCDRTPVWFWTMMDNMGISFSDDEFMLSNVEKSVDIMLNREYQYDGGGGALFIVPNPRRDLTMTDIWYQMMWYLADLDE